MGLMVVAATPACTRRGRWRLQQFRPRHKRKRSRGQLPTGVVHRSHGHMAILRAAKLVKRLEGVRGSRQEGLERLAMAWNTCHGL
eukprot:6389375-Prorocentrum_lima.AAC.1